MNKLQFFVVLITFLFSMNSMALSPEAIEGKSFYPACHICHDQLLDPPLGPPMWGVQRLYKNNTIDDEDFVQSMVDFVKVPALEKVIHNEAVRQLGLMAPLPLPDDILKKIATYILEEQFPPPCAHWAIAARRANKKGDIEHAKKDLNMLKRFCE